LAAEPAPDALIDPVGIKVDGWIYPFLFGMDIPEIVQTVFHNPMAALALAPLEPCGQTWAREVPGARLHVFADSGHVPPDGRCRKALPSFLTLSRLCLPTHFHEDPKIAPYPARVRSAGCKTRGATREAQAVRRAADHECGERAPGEAKTLA
jgi:hypothetical protein